MIFAVDRGHCDLEMVCYLSMLTQLVTVEPELHQPDFYLEHNMSTKDKAEGNVHGVSVKLSVPSWPLYFSKFPCLENGCGHLSFLVFF